MDLIVVGPDSGNLVSTETCYFSAASDKEEAYEQDVNGVPHGAFTYSLAQFLKPKKIWGTVQTEVRGAVTSILVDAAQTPTLSAGFESIPVYGSKGSVPVPVGGDDPMGSSYGQLDPSALSLTLSTGTSILRVGQHFQITAKATIPGYLVILNKDVDGKINVLYPDPGQIPVQTMSGQVIPLPKPGHSYAAEKPGIESLRAFLAPDLPSANAILNWARGTSSKVVVVKSHSIIFDLALQIVP